jgi:colicin import membrane protein
LPTETPAKKPKKKRGRPKGSTNKLKKLKAKAPKVEKPQFETNLGETKTKKPTTISPSETGLAVSKVAAEVVTTKPAEQKPAPPTKPPESFSDKYRQDRIFRREMGEPEFWIGKKGLVTLRPMRTKEEEQEISRKVLIPIIQSTPYSPEYILSPEFKGTSSYELGIESLKQEWEEKLQRIKANPDSSTQQLTQTEKDLKTLDHLYSNFYNGMNVFRTAKGGRDKLRK